ncbi:MAG: AraC family transcriptional regulator [Firmicutes bacterium]|nr:AraC family transcriptional regulator [Bacillota bacterium]MDY6160731.1 AraC family transcriptional regulator [Candidatus Faecousia sp.]
MTQPLKNAIPYTIGQEMLDQFLARQSKVNYVRSISGNLESVEFQPNSSLRLWYNNTMLSYDPHWHSAYEMIVPIEGNYLVNVCGQTFDLAPGDIFLIPGGEPHSLKAPARGGRFIFLFEFDQILAIKGASYLASCMAKPLLINRSTCPAIYAEEADLFGRICWEYLHDDSLRDISVYSQLLTIFLNYGKYRLSSESSPSMLQLPHSSQRNYAERFEAVFDYLDRHFAEDLTLEDAAAVAGFSKFHFSRTFKQLSGCNFYEYLCHRRIKTSETLLMKPGLSISQIALQSGFSSVSTFNRTFKKLKGCTPTQYRGMFQVRLDDHDQGEHVK